MKILSTASYKFLRPALGDGLPHPQTLRCYAHPDDINVGLDLNHLENAGKFSENLAERNFDCIICSDLGYGDEKTEYVNGLFVGLAQNRDDILPAKNVLIFLFQAVTGRFRMVVAYYFVKGLLEKQLKDILLTLLIQIRAKTNLRVIAWGSDHGADNQGCRKELIRDEIFLHGDFRILEDWQEKLLT